MSSDKPDSEYLGTIIPALLRQEDLGVQGQSGLRSFRTVGATQRKSVLEKKKARDISSMTELVLNEYRAYIEHL